MSQIIAVGNQKGGVGKTTTAVTLGHYFALSGKHVLIVDLDSQGHVAVNLGLSSSNGLYRLLVAKQSLPHVAPSARPGLDIIPNDHTAEAVKIHSLQTPFREYLIRNALAGADYDLIFLDMPPSTNILHISALLASHYLLVPAIMDYLALESVSQILGTLTSLKGISKIKPPALLGILPTFYDRVTNETALNLHKLGEMIGVQRILPPIPKDTKVREASHHGQTVWEYAPKTKAAVGYPNNHARLRINRSLTGGYTNVAKAIMQIWRE